MEQREEVMDVFQKVCLEKQAVLTVSKPETASSIHYGLEKQTFLYRNRLPVTIRLAGNYQITNALLALQAAEILQQKGFRITDRAIFKGHGADRMARKVRDIVPKAVFYRRWRT